MQQEPPRRFIYRDLPYFKTEVEFDFVRPGARDGEGRLLQPTDPKDTVRSFEPIRLEVMDYD